MTNAVVDLGGKATKQTNKANRVDPDLGLLCFQKRGKGPKLLIFIITSWAEMNYSVHPNQLA